MRSNRTTKVKPTCELERTCLLLVYLLAAPRTPKVHGIFKVRVPHFANKWPRSMAGPRFDILKKTVGRETGSPFPSRLHITNGACSRKARDLQIWRGWVLCNVL